MLVFKDFLEDKLPDSVGEEWNGLLSDSSADTIFLTWEWILCWWQVYGAKYQLALTLVYNESDKLVGAAPFKVRKLTRLPGLRPVKVLEFIGWGRRSPQNTWM